MGMQMIVVLAFDIEDQQQQLEVFEALQKAELPHRTGAVHLAIEESADRVLAVFEEDHQ